MESDQPFDPDRLRELRIDKGLSQLTLAYNSGLSVTTISRVECGVNTPSLETLARLADALEVPPEEFFEPNGRRKKR